MRERFATYVAAELNLLMKDDIVPQTQVEELVWDIQEMAFAPANDS